MRWMVLMNVQSCIIKINSKRFDSNVRRNLPCNIATVANNIEKGAWQGTFRRLNDTLFLITQWLRIVGES